MSVLLIPTADPESGSTIRWRVGPGLVRVTGSVPRERLPGPLRALADDGVLTAVRVQPGRVETTFADAPPTSVDGARVRSALYDVLSAPGGWPDDEPSADDGAASDHSDISTSDTARAADRELAQTVTTILQGEFGMYAASHGGRIELVDVHDGIVTVALGGACHGCAAANVTLSRNLASRLRREPGFSSLASTDDPPVERGRRP